ncbi:MAG: glycan-binding surface protein [Bacteroidota bacterium]
MKLPNNLYVLLFLCALLSVIYSCSEEDEFFPKAMNTSLPVTTSEALNSLEEFSTFRDMLDRTGLRDSLLNDADIYLMLAPINSGLNEADLLSLDDVALQNLLLNHLKATVTPDFTDVLTSGYYQTLATGPNGNLLSQYLHKSEDGAIVINGQTRILESQKNIGTTNGVIHGVDHVIPLPTVADHLAANPNYSMFSAAIDHAGITLLSESGTVTVFAPTNLAFEKFMLDVNTLFGWSTLEEIPTETLQEVLTYHLVSDQNLLSAQADGTTQESVQGGTFMISGTSVSDTSEQDANIVTGDIQGINGIIHGIDKVILTEGIYQQVLVVSLNFMERLEDRGFTDLVAAIDLVGLTDSLSNVTEVTAFAPSNSAFNSLFEGVANFGSLDDFDTPEEIAELKKLLTYHLFPGTLLESQLVDNATITTAFGTDLTVDLSEGQPNLIPSSEEAIPSKVINGNIGATNGIIHEIDRVLIASEFLAPLGIGPTLNLIDKLEDKAFTSLVSAIDLVGLTDSLSNVSEITVFAPNNDAFNALFADAENFGSLSDFDTPEEIAELKKLLKYHLFSETLLESQLFDGNTVTTAFGTDLTIGLSEGMPSLDPSFVAAVPSKIVNSGIDATNGVIHEIDRVLIANEFVGPLGIETVIHPVINEALVFFDWDDPSKGHWWGLAVNENDAALSLDGGNYGHVTMHTDTLGWFDLFWRNGTTLNGANVVGSNLSSYALKFDINTLVPFSEGQVTFRFKSSVTGVDAVYAWAPWKDTGEAYATDGWVTVEIPLTEIGQSDFTDLDMEFGAAFQLDQDLSVTVDFIIDNIRFDAPGVN